MLATVKGDVHDIGKNIVGVVLQCNNYEVFDLGVMVPAEAILEKAREVDADIVGLSGLITPSLDQMVHVASEMERAGMEIPLLIGGATTSRVHTAVKIEERYSGPTIHVLDASRCAEVAGKLLDPGTPVGRTRPASVKNTRPCAAGERSDATPDLPCSRSRTPARTGCRWTGTGTPPSARPGPVTGFSPPPRDRLVAGGHGPSAAPSAQTAASYDLDELVERIDWTPFFQAWELRGAYPDILSDPGGRSRGIESAPGRTRPSGASPEERTPGRASRRRAIPGQRRGRRHRALR